MKRYIRTKNGKIIDTTKLSYSVIADKNGNEISDRTYTLEIDKNTIQLIKIGINAVESGTIEGLIKVGDLTNLGFIKDMTTTDLHIDNVFVCYKDDEYITELYTKQGNNYILVARKENGEWRVI